MQLFVALLALLCAASSSAESHWCYEIQTKEPGSNCEGPSHWPGSCQNKNHQSPINIVTSKAKLNYDLKPFTFVGYNQKESWVVLNNKHSVKMLLGDGICISGGGLPAQYKAVQLHLHWSEDVNRGSEHSIDGKYFAMEMHIVHQKMSSDAVQDSKDKIAVLGFMIEVGNQINNAFQPLVKALSHISKPYTNTTMEESCLEDMIPTKDKLTSYFRYLGSLTTPECDETVIWTVFKEPIKIHKDQFLEFSKKVYYDEDQKFNMKDNVRPVQQLGDRQVFKSRAPGQLLSMPLPALLVTALTCLAVSFLQ